MSDTPRTDAHYFIEETNSGTVGLGMSHDFIEFTRGLEKELDKHRWQPREELTDEQELFIHTNHPVMKALTYDNVGESLGLGKENVKMNNKEISIYKNDKLNLSDFMCASRKLVGVAIFEPPITPPEDMNDG